jgi:hypothetical protein
LHKEIAGAPSNARTAISIYLWSDPPEYSVVTERARTVENRLGRPVQVLYFDTSSSVDRKSLRKASMKAIAQGPKLFVVGDQTRLAELLD